MTTPIPTDTACPFRGTACQAPTVCRGVGLCVVDPASRHRPIPVALPEPPACPAPRACAISIDRRLRTAPHGDRLFAEATAPSQFFFRSAIGLLQEFDGDVGHRWPRFILHPAHPAQRRWLDAEGPLRLRLRRDRPPMPSRLVSVRREPGDRLWTPGEDAAPRFTSSLWGGLPSWNEVTERLTPGSLKLAGARIAAASKGTDAAAEMARQIDFEWEERRWRVPGGDAAAVENGMGC